MKDIEPGLIGQPDRAPRPEAAERGAAHASLRDFGERHFYRTLLRSANWVGDVTRFSRRPLSAAELMGAAQRRTGLTDFGDRSFEGGLEILLRGYETEANLTAVGRIAARWDAVRYLSNLLLLRAEEKRDPAIADEPVCQPLFIVGMPRSGTTFLHKLLAEDPANRVVRCWETIYPTPGRDGRDGDPAQRRRKADRQMAGFARLAPDFPAVHPITASSPQECSEITGHVFKSFRFDTTHRVPSYMRWLCETGHADAFRFHRRFLAYLQHRKGAGRWVLKCPDHVFVLDAIRSVYPDAGFVFMHRDPLEVLPSLARLTETVRGPFTRGVDRAELGAELARTWACGAAIMIEEAESDRATGGRVAHVTFRRFVEDPFRCAAALYEHFGLDLGAEAAARMRRLVAEQPRGGYGRHAARLEHYGLDSAAERRRFDAYKRYFGV
jgi:hypothetical protein